MSYLTEISSEEYKRVMDNQRQPSEKEPVNYRAGYTPPTAWEFGRGDGNYECSTFTRATVEYK